MKRNLVPVVGIAIVLAGLAGTWLWLGPGNHATAADNPGAAVPAGEADRLSASLDANAKSAFSDGKITNPEYEAAVNATVKCIRDAGIQVTDPVWSGGRLRYTASYQDRAVEPLIDACYDAHLRGVDIVAQAASR